jgi:hypothetical protein
LGLEARDEERAKADQSGKEVLLEIAHVKQVQAVGFGLLKIQPTVLVGTACLRELYRAEYSRQIVEADLHLEGDQPVVSRELLSQGLG